MTWGIVASVGGTIVGGLLQDDAAGDAADSQSAATAAQIAEQRRQFDLTRGDYAPYRETGVRALRRLETDIRRLPTAREVQADPGYQFGLDQGQQAIDRKTAASGGRISGAALKAAAQYGTNYATSGYNAAYQRRADRLNRLAALAGVGQTGVAGSAAAGANAANNISAALGAQGDAAAAAQLARGNIWGDTVNALGAIGTRWARDYG